MRRLIRTVIIVILAIFLLMPVTVLATAAYTITVIYADSKGVQLKNPVSETFTEGTDVKWLVEDDKSLNFTFEHDEETTVTEVENGYLIEINNIDKDHEITYTLADETVSYKLIKHFENIENDEFTTYESVLYGSLYDTVPKDSDIEAPAGFTLSAKEEEQIGLNTTVNVHYTRNRYRVSFILNGGTGIDSEYVLKHGEKLNLNKPEKEGYRFIGYVDEHNEETELNNYEVVSNKTFRAIWQKEDNLADVTVIYWGENADYDNYSLLSEEVIQAEIGAVFKIDETNSNYNAHEHNQYCFGASSTAVSIDPEVLEVFEELAGGIEDGYIYCFNDRGILGEGMMYFLRFNGDFYLSAADNIAAEVGEPKTVKNSMFDAMDYYHKYETKISCERLYTIKHSDSITVNETGNVVNVYLDRVRFTWNFVRYRLWKYTDSLGSITAKWGQNVYEEFLKICNDSKEYSFSVVGGSSRIYLHLLITMSPNSVTYYANGNVGLHEVRYKLENEAGEYITKYKSRWFLTNKLTEEDFIDIEGYELNEEKNKEEGTVVGASVGTNGRNIYYKRKTYNLIFMDEDKELGREEVRYLDEVSSVIKNFEIPEKEHYLYDYLKIDERKVEDEEFVMPARDVIVMVFYKKKKYEVTFYEDETLIVPIYTEEVEYLNKVNELPDTGNEETVWVYKDEGEEKIFNKLTTEIVKSLDVYPKKSETTLYPYAIKYCLNGLEIAKKKMGLAAIGSTIHITPKEKLDLYQEYRLTVCPDNESYDLFIKETDNEYTFNYHLVDTSYIVRYINEENGEALKEEKRVEHYSLNTVTESAPPIENYVPTGVITRTVSLKENDDNEIIFYYRFDENKVVVIINQYQIDINNNIVKLDEEKTFIENKNSKFVYPLDYRLIDQDKSFEESNVNFTFKENEITADINDYTVYLNLYYRPVKNLTINVRGLEKDESMLIKISGKGIEEGLIVDLKDTVTIKDLYVGETYKVTEEIYEYCHYKTDDLYIKINNYSNSITIKKFNKNNHYLHNETKVVNIYELS